MYKQASRLNLMFQCRSGLITVSDLWVLPLYVLDSMAVELNKSVTEKELSFIPGNVSKEKENHDKLRLEIVVDVINTLCREKEEAKLLKEKKEQKERILELLHRKENEKFEELSAEELKTELDKLSQ